MQHTLFELQTVDWRSGQPIPAERLRAQIRQLQAQGVHHFAWYPDDFIAGQPSTHDARAACPPAPSRTRRSDMDMHPLLQVLFQFAFYYPMVMAFFWMSGGLYTTSGANATRGRATTLH